MSILLILFEGKANIFLMIIHRVSPKLEPRLQMLTELAQPIKELFYFGDFLDLLDRPFVAIVGSRKVSAYGKAVTTKLASELAKAGVVIISGLALGVDSIAHTAALSAGGKTIAVLPSGLDTIYPAAHHVLAQKIVTQGGALVTEYPAGEGQPQKYQFIARNRIIAALSRGVLITEAASKSGSLHTANFALEQGIEVFAVPGNITSPTSVGTNELIKTGANPVTSARDILEALGINAQIPTYVPEREDEAAVYALLTEGVQDTATLLARSGLSTANFQQAISMLEIAGAIQQTGVSSWSAI